MAGETEATIRRLRQLKGLGVDLAIDDFGTGYSSLSYLRRFPIDVVKIDKSFVDGIATAPTSSALARAIVRLAHSLKMKTVAEGVETRGAGQATAHGMGCDQAQGFQFARPMDARRGHRYVLGHTTISLWVGHSGHELEVIKAVVADFEALNPGPPRRGRRRRRRRARSWPPCAADGARTSSARSNRRTSAPTASSGGLVDLAPWMARDDMDAGSLTDGHAGLHALRRAGAGRCRCWPTPTGCTTTASSSPTAGAVGPPRTISELTDYAKRLTDAQPRRLAAGRRVQPAVRVLRELARRPSGTCSAPAGSTTTAGRASPPTRRWARDASRGRRSSSTGTATKTWSRSRREVGRRVLADRTRSRPGRLAMCLDGEWRVAFIAAEAPDLDYGTAPLPVDDARPELYGSGYINGTIIGIPSNADPQGRELEARASTWPPMTERSPSSRTGCATCRRRELAALAGPRRRRAVRGLPRHLRAPAIGHHPDHCGHRRVPGDRVDLPAGMAGGGDLRPGCRSARGGSQDRDRVEDRLTDPGAGGRGGRGGHIRCGTASSLTPATHPDPRHRLGWSGLRPGLLTHPLKTCLGPSSDRATHWPLSNACHAHGLPGRLRADVRRSNAKHCGLPVCGAVLGCDDCRASSLFNSRRFGRDDRNARRGERNSDGNTLTAPHADAADLAPVRRPVPSRVATRNSAAAVTEAIDRLAGLHSYHFKLSTIGRTALQLDADSLIDIGAEGSVTRAPSIAVDMLASLRLIESAFDGATGSTEHVVIVDGTGWGFRPSDAATRGRDRGRCVRLPVEHLSAHGLRIQGDPALRRCVRPGWTRASQRDRSHPLPRHKTPRVGSLCLGRRDEWPMDRGPVDPRDGRYLIAAEIDCTPPPTPTPSPGAPRRREPGRTIAASISNWKSPTPTIQPSRSRRRPDLHWGSDVPGLRVES